MMDLNERRAPLAEINVTPFVDVMLVLLIIFMVAAPLLRQGFTVSLPKAATGQAVPQTDLIITLSKEQVLSLNDEVVTLAELRQQLSQIERSRPVFIRSDRYAYVNNLIEIWDLCRQSGLRNVHVATLTE